MSAALLRAVDPRLRGGELALGTFEAAGPLLVLVGAWGPLFQLITGQLELADGALELGGAPAQAAAARGAVGVLLREPGLPLGWSVREVVLESAALLGAGPLRARRDARHVLGELGLAPLASKKLSRLRPAEQRAVALACALLGDPPLLALEEPFTGLSPSAQLELAPSLERALRGRQALVSVPALPDGPGADALAAWSQELLLLSERRLVARCSYRDLGARARSYRVTLQRSVDGVLSRLGEAGYEVRPMSTPQVTTLLVTDPAGLGTVPLFGAALAAGAPIIELVPAAPGAVPDATGA